VADSTTERPDSPAAVPPDPYAPFYIWISGTADAPQVAVDHAPGGDLAQSALDVRYLPAVQRLAGLVHGGATDPGTVANLGRGLYAILFTPALRDLYQRSLGRLAAGGRLRLLLRVDPPALAALPWELLYDPTDNVFLALDPLVSVARYLPQAARPAPAPRSGPLRVLAVFAGPTDLPALDLPPRTGPDRDGVADPAAGPGGARRADGRAHRRRGPTGHRAQGAAHARRAPRCHRRRV
jgi:hypothetical protein